MPSRVRLESKFASASWRASHRSSLLPLKTPPKFSRGWSGGIPPGQPPAVKRR